jgi:hypothetical protein
MPWRQGPTATAVAAGRQCDGAPSPVSKVKALVPAAATGLQASRPWAPLVCEPQDSFALRAVTAASAIAWPSVSIAVVTISGPDRQEQHMRRSGSVGAPSLLCRSRAGAPPGNSETPAWTGPHACRFYAAHGRHAICQLCCSCADTSVSRLVPTGRSDLLKGSAAVDDARLGATLVVFSSGPSLVGAT